MLFFLSRCAYRNSMALNDVDAATMMLDTNKLIQTSLLLISMAEDPRLRYDSECSNEWLSWSFRSVEHIIWLNDLYECLRMRYNTWHSTDRRQSPICNIAREYFCCYPHNLPPNEWEDPQNLAQERAYYAKHRVNRDKYKQVQVPHWAPKRDIVAVKAYSPAPVKSWGEVQQFFDNLPD